MTIINGNDASLALKVRAAAALLQAERRGGVKVARQAAGERAAYGVYAPQAPPGLPPLRRMQAHDKFSAFEPPAPPQLRVVDDDDDGDDDG